MQSRAFVRFAEQCRLNLASWRYRVSTASLNCTTDFSHSRAPVPTLSEPFSTATFQSYQQREPLLQLPFRHDTLRCLFGHASSTKYDERKLIGYSPDQMFKVVSQVEDYHRFVPWCVKSTVIKRNPSNYIECELEVGFQVFVERYTSKIRLSPPNSLTTVTEDSTLFHHLESLWKFEKGPTPDSCWLSFHVEFAFKSPLYKHVATVFFEEVVKRMMSAFVGRCGDLYGPSSLTPPSRSAKAVRLA